MLAAYYLISNRLTFRFMADSKMNGTLGAGNGFDVKNYSGISDHLQFSTAIANTPLEAPVLNAAPIP